MGCWRRIQKAACPFAKSLSGDIRYERDLSRRSAAKADLPGLATSIRTRRGRVSHTPFALGLQTGNHYIQAAARSSTRSVGSQAAPGGGKGRPGGAPRGPHRTRTGGQPPPCLAVSGAQLPASFQDAESLVRFPWVSLRSTQGYPALNPPGSVGLIPPSEPHFSATACSSHPVRPRCR